MMHVMLFGSASWRAGLRHPWTMRWLVLGALLWGAAGALMLSLHAQSQQLVAMRESALQTSFPARRGTPPVRAAQVPSPSNVQSFRSGFPSMADRQQRLKSLLEISSRHGLRWQRVELRQTIESSIGMARYEVTLPLNGSYAAIRQTVDEALAGDRGLALDRLQLRRPSAANAELDATAVWSLWMQASDSPDVASRQ